MIKSVRQIVCSSLILGGLLAGNVNAGDALWTTNYAQAQKDAAKAGKSLLMDFSGSDWCGWCIKLDEEVFAHDVFKEAVTKDFVPVLLDYPKDKSKIPADVQAQNKRLMDKYAIAFKGYPTVILADAKGRPYATTGYQAGGPEAYLKHLAELRQKGVEIDKHLKQAAAPELKPMDKARLLDKAVDGVDLPILVEFYGDIVDHIMALDKDNKAGIKKKYELRLRAAEAEKALADRNPEKAIELYEAVIRDFQPTGEQAQALYFSLSEAYFGARKMDKAKAGLDKALQAAPESQFASRIKMIVEKYFSEPSK
jgi:thioredoxin-related protein